MRKLLLASGIAFLLCGLRPSSPPGLLVTNVKFTVDADISFSNTGYSAGTMLYILGDKGSGICTVDDNGICVAHFKLMTDSVYNTYTFTIVKPDNLDEAYYVQTYIVR